MTINFSQVKTLTIPEGSVKKITDSSGKVLWQSQSWHTIWEGSKTIKTSAKNEISGAVSNFASTANGTGFTPHLRITFSIDYDNNTYDTIMYYNNSMTPQTQRPSSPLEIESVASNDNMILLGRYQSEQDGFTIEALLVKNNDTNNNKISFSLSGNFSGKVPNLYASSYYVSMTVTKIEQYY